MEQIIKKWKEANLKNYTKKYPKDIITNAQLYTIELWLRSSDATRHRKRLFKLSVPDALKISQRWESRQLFCQVPQMKDSGSSLIKQYSDGFRWVKLNTDDSFAYEGTLMKHCVYDQRHRTDCLVFSLRNSNNYPICTVEIKKDGTLFQFKGKFNNPVESFYHKYLIDFFITNPIVKITKTTEDIIYLGYCFIQQQHYHLNNLPNEAHIQHNVKLFNNDIKKFNCKKLVILGNLNLTQLNQLESLPEHLIVYGDINIAFCSKLKQLPKILQASGQITIDSCNQIKEFPLFLKAKQIQVTNCGFLDWKNIKNIVVDSHISCFKTNFNQTFLKIFKMTNDSGTWQTYQLKLIPKYKEIFKFIINSSKKIFDLFYCKN